MNGKIEKSDNGAVRLIKFTHAIFSDGDRHGSSSSSSLSSLGVSKPSSPEILKDEDVNISGTGRIEGRLLPIQCVVEKQSNKRLID